MYKKRITALIITVIIATATQTIPASAAIHDPPSITARVSQIISPMWTSTSKIIPSISNSGRRISTSVLIIPKNKTEKTKGTLYLQKYNGRKWQNVKSWTIDTEGTVDITKSYRGKENEKYRTKVVVTTGEDKITATSNEITT